MVLHVKRPTVKPFEEKAPAPEVPRKKTADELTDEDFERVASKAIDYKPGQGREAAPAPVPTERPVKGRMVGKKIQTTLTISPAMMAWLDGFAESRGMTRTACIMQAISEMKQRNGG